MFIRANEGHGGELRYFVPCTVFTLLGFIITVSLAASTHCIMGGPALACLAP